VAQPVPDIGDHAVEVEHRERSVGPVVHRPTLGEPWARTRDRQADIISVSAMRPDRTSEVGRHARP
jgi:hypothetical protein